MDTASYLTAAFLGFIEGLTEFIPVSSTGHLLLLTDRLQFNAIPGHFFEIFIQLGAIVAVAVLYRRKIGQTVAGIFTADRTAQRFALNIIAATIPALALGALGHRWIQDTLYNPAVIATTLIAGGVVILIFDSKFTNPKINSVDDLSAKTSLLLGCAQAVALIPGVSRSGATIMGGLALGLSRAAAAELSFFMAMPVMLAAVLFDAYKSWPELSAAGAHFGLLAAGFIMAFITAAVTVKAAMWFIVRYGFKPFGWYRIALGIVVLLTLHA